MSVSPGSVIQETPGLASTHRTPITVKTVGLTWLDRSFQVLIVCLFPIGVLFVIYLSGPRPPVNVPLQLFEIVVVLAAIDFALEELTSVRSITLDPEGVRFRFIIHIEARKWGDLTPGKAAPEHRGWWILSPRRDGKPARQRAYRISFAQARAILNYPTCPKWDLKPGIREALGLAQAIS